MTGAELTAAEQHAITEAERIETLEGAMLQLPQVECPVEHIFGPGLYIRQISVKAGTLVVGHRHRQAHTNMLLRGSMLIADEQGVTRIDAPMVWIATPGRKVFLMLEDGIFQNLYPTELTDPDAIEERFIEHSDTWAAHQETKALVERLHTASLSDTSTCEE